MANSLVKLTLESNQYESGIRQAQKSWNDFTKGIGMSAAKFTAVGAAIGATTAALKVAKDAFFKNEQQLDEWNRAVESSKSVYSGFLNALNTGDISGFLSNINTITEAARAAYDALDELNTFNAFNQIQTQKSRTGFTEAMAGFRLGENSKEDVQNAAKEYQEELRQRQKREAEAYSQAIRKIAAERGVAWGALEQALTGKYGDYEQLKNTMPTGKQTKFLPGGQFGGATAIEVPMAVTAQEKMGQALRALNDTELQELQALGAQAYRTGEEIAQIDKQMARVLNKRDGTTGTTGGGRSGGGGGRTKVEQTEMQQLQASIKALEDEYVKLGAVTTEDAKKRMSEIRSEISENEKRIGQIELLREQSHGKLLGGLETDLAKVDTSSLTNTLIPSIDEISQYFKDNPIIIPVEAPTKDVKAIAQTASMTADVVASIGDAFNAIEDPASKVAGTVMQAIASVALGYAQATVQAAQAGPWAWIAFAASGLATMLATISEIHSSTGYAHGGTIEGSTYSGDQIPIMANAGEVILNRAQAGNVASQLEGNGLGNLHVVGKLHGTDMLLLVDRALKMQGKELATWGRG